MSLNGLELTKGQSISVLVILENELEVAEDRAVFNYRPLIK